MASKHPHFTPCKDDLDRARKKIDRSGTMKSMIQEARVQLIKCGWKDEMLTAAKESIGSRGGVAEITLEELIVEVTETGIISVPNEIKASIMSQLKDSLNESSGGK